MIGLVAVVALATMASAGIGTRPHYVAGLLIAVVGAVGCYLLVPSRIEMLRAADDTQRLGTQFLFDYGPPVVVVWLAMAFGCLLAPLSTVAQRISETVGLSIRTVSDLRRRMGLGRAGGTHFRAGA